MSASDSASPSKQSTIDLCHKMHIDDRVYVELSMVYPGIEGTLNEHWTASRNALVLTGSVDALVDVAQLLDLSPAIVVEVHRGEAVLALWGEALETYQYLKGHDHLELDHRSTD